MRAYDGAPNTQKKDKGKRVIAAYEAFADAIVNECDGCQGLPVVTFSRSRVPKIVQNIEAGFSANKKRKLHRITDDRAIAANRRAACGSAECGSGESCDEYPFASSQEGGAGAVRLCVPERQNNSQGGTLSAFYQRESIGNNDEYCVQLED